MRLTPQSMSNKAIALDELEEVHQHVRIRRAYNKQDQALKEEEEKKNKNRK